MAARRGPQAMRNPVVTSSNSAVSNATRRGKIPRSQAIRSGYRALANWPGVEGVDDRRIDEGPSLLLLPYGHAERLSSTIALRFAWRMTLYATVGRRSLPFQTPGGICSKRRTTAVTGDEAACSRIETSMCRAAVAWLHMALASLVDRFKLHAIRAASLNPRHGNPTHDGHQ